VIHEDRAVVRSGLNVQMLEQQKLQLQQEPHPLLNTNVMMWNTGGIDRTRSWNCWQTKTLQNDEIQLRLPC